MSHVPVVKFVITGIHMGLGHSGLNEVIAGHKKKNKLFAQVLKQEGGLVLFLNSKHTACKLYSENGSVLGYLRPTGGGKITYNSIDQIPATFGGSVSYSTAVKAALKKYLEAEVKRVDKSVLEA